MDRIRSKPPSSQQVCLRDNIKSLNVCEVERVLCWDVPDGMENSVDLTYKKTSHGCQHQTYVETQLQPTI